MRKTLIGLMVGAGASAILALPFIVRHLWHSFVFSSHQAPSISWPDWLAGAMAACLSLGLLAGCLRDAARAERMSGRARMIMALGLGGLFGLLTARARFWPEPGDRSLLYLAAGVLAGAVLLKATANRRPKADRRGLLRQRQFSMRGLLAAVLFISAGLALLISGPIQRWRLSTELTLRGVRIDYDDSTWDFWQFFLGEAAQPFSDDIDRAELPSSAGDKELALLAKRGGAKMLTLRGSRITDGGLASLRSMDRLWSFYCDGAPVTDVGLRNLRGLKQLRV